LVFHLVGPILGMPPPVGAAGVGAASHLLLGQPGLKALHFDHSSGLQGLFARHLYTTLEERNLTTSPHLRRNKCSERRDAFCNLAYHRMISRHRPLPCPCLRQRQDADDAQEGPQQLQQLTQHPCCLCLHAAPATAALSRNPPNAPALPTRPPRQATLNNPRRAQLYDGVFHSLYSSLVRKTDQVTFLNSRLLLIFSVPSDLQTGAVGAKNSGGNGPAAVSAASPARTSPAAATRSPRERGCRERGADRQQPDSRDQPGSTSPAPARAQQTGEQQQQPGNSRAGKHLLGSRDQPSSTSLAAARARLTRWQHLPGNKYKAPLNSVFPDGLSRPWD
jgi:hypothetical protein